MGRGPKPAKSKAAKPPVARKSPKDDRAKVRDLEKRLAESLEREKAAGEILRVISTSPTDVQPVFDTIVESAARLCEGLFGTLFSFDGELIHVVAARNWTATAFDVSHRVFPAHPSRALFTGRAILDRAVVHVPDVELDREHEHHEMIHAVGFRSYLAVPMLRDGVPLGVIAVGRAEPGPFSDNQIALLQTFADQAVIAIENVRLFTELQEKNRAVTQAHAQVTEALEQQTATAEILRVISQSPTDVQPVFDAIVRSASRLCDGEAALVARFDGALIHLAAQYNLRPGTEDVLPRLFPRPPGREMAAGRAIMTGTIVHIPDAHMDPDYDPEVARPQGLRSVLVVPMLREGKPIGCFGVSRARPGAFSDTHIELMKTFADQAVIAIENVRLFKELQTSNRELTTALDKQTATSDILRVISQSQTDVQPVFDAIVSSAVRLLRGYSGALIRVAGDRLELAALTSTGDVGVAAQRARFPLPLQSPGPHAETIRARAPINVVDAQTDPGWESEHAYARARGYRSVVAVPLLRHRQAIGAIVVTRRELGGFTDDEIALLETFADQAVIAIENARLLTELQTRTAELTRSVGELTALGEVGRALSSTLDLETVLQTIVQRANELAGTAGCAIWEYDEAREEFRLRASDYVDEEDAAALQVAAPVTTIRRGLGVTSQVMELRQPVQIHDIAVGGAEENPIRQRLIAAGHHALLAVPLLREDEVLGVLVVTRKTPGEFQPEVVQLLSTFATQSALAIQNARLFREIADKSRQLEAASQHKSEFLANMSHELRTPLNAIIGFSEVLSERMFGELNEKQEEYSKDIHASGQHLLSLINDILDLSKIEAGRMELELTDFDLPTAIENALMLVRERAGRRNLTLHKSVDAGVGQLRADERKIRQVVLNLLSNAIKFTPEGGRIEVGAVPRDGFVEVSVSDTGVGIAPEDQERVFEEFRQVGTADKNAEGTGLGLTLCRKFVEGHGGRIWVKSQVGQGSVFTFTIPVIQ
jgi:two-component system, NtrC family, sensor kinase